ncbi:MAG: hypothetical protein IIZ94_14435 [Prevotella sp.]|nr:hypothetical protein [Prevotella sp.]
MNFIYKVEIGCRGEYTFTNKFDALRFAELAKGHQDEDEEVTITVEREEE